MRRPWLWVVLLGLVWTSGALAAPSARDRVIAQALFEDGRRLMQQGRLREACVKFEESNRLDPAMGTQFNLADCYEATGLITRAWILFVDVAAAARATGQTEREQAARKRAAALAPRLSRLAIAVDHPVEGLTVRRNGELVPRPQWGTAVPVEPGTHRIEARAPGRRSWHGEVEVQGEGSTVTVSVPRLAGEVAPSPEGGLDMQRAAAIAMGALAVGAAAAGTAAGVVAIERKNEADRHCPEPGLCEQRGFELRDEAREAAAVSTVSFVVAGSAAIGSLLLWLTAPDDPESSRLRVEPIVGPSAGGVSLRVTF